MVHQSQGEVVKNLRQPRNLVQLLSGLLQGCLSRSVILIKFRVSSLRPKCAGVKSGEGAEKLLSPY